MKAKVKVNWIANVIITTIFKISIRKTLKKKKKEKD